MELFLNILWLAIAVAGVCVWRFRWAQQRRAREHSPWCQWTAFASALVLLFFMVSLTDDLHSELMYFEECSASRRHTTCLACPHHSPQKPLAGMYSAIQIIPSFSQRLLAISSVNPVNDSAPALIRVGTVSDRAPPVIVL